MAIPVSPQCSQGAMSGRETRVSADCPVYRAALHFNPDSGSCYCTGILHFATATIDPGIFGIQFFANS